MSYRKSFLTRSVILYFKNTICYQILCWQTMAYLDSGQVSDACTLRGYTPTEAIFKHFSRFLSRIVVSETNSLVAGLTKIPLPPHLCLTCCSHASKRLPLMVVRNPFARLLSSWRKLVLMKPLCQGREEPIGEKKQRQLELCELPAFIEYTHRVFSDNYLLSEIREAAVKSKEEKGNSLNGNADIVPSTWPLSVAAITHMIPVYTLWVETPGSLRTRKGFFLHLERVEEDLEALSMVLCKEYAHCEPLPPFTDESAAELSSKATRLSHVRKQLGGADLTEELRQQVAVIYANDFALLGYNADNATDLLPTRPPGGWLPGGAPWSAATAT
eukprot:TRINITY_DN21157_c0_g1_i4.p1 TRINITY_DN21157_c0_g1~~TRINITY_DN21157_c0_g1_i4.p1  ORF type:complete len:329 (+),score=43.25 TRINITY_DN21157_c0_g1_i4:59-1045(+)